MCIWGQFYWDPMWLIPWGLWRQMLEKLLWSKWICWNLVILQWRMSIICFWTLSLGSPTWGTTKPNKSPLNIGEKGDINLTFHDDDKLHWKVMGEILLYIQEKWLQEYMSLVSANLTTLLHGGGGQLLVAFRWEHQAPAWEAIVGWPTTSLAMLTQYWSHCTFLWEDNMEDAFEAHVCIYIGWHVIWKGFFDVFGANSG